MLSVFTRKKTIFEFSAGVLLLIFLATFSYINLTQLGNAVSWVKHTYIVKERLSNLETLVRAAESSQRGYLLTSKVVYLIEYNNAIDDIAIAENYLITLLGDNQLQTQRLKAMYTTLEQRVQVLSTVIDLKEQGRNIDVKTIVDSSKGKQLMDKLMGQVKEMQGIEDNLLDVRLQEQERSLESSISAVIFGGVISIVIVFGAVVIINNNREIDK